MEGESKKESKTAKTRGIKMLLRYTSKNPERVITVRRLAKRLVTHEAGMLALAEGGGVGC
jgi:hypothetical protein